MLQKALVGRSVPQPRSQHQLGPCECQRLRKKVNWGLFLTGGFFCASHVQCVWSQTEEVMRKCFFSAAFVLNERQADNQDVDCFFFLILEQITKQKYSCS